MTELEKKKARAELLRVQAAKAEMEFIIAQRQEEIDKLLGHIKIQEESEQKLLEKLKN